MIGKRRCQAGTDEPGTYLLNISFTNLRNLCMILGARKGTK